MHSETQTLCEGSATHPSAPRVPHQSVSEDPISLADDAKTFRVAVVIGLVMVGGLSLFLPDKMGCPTYEVMAPESLEGLDLAQHASTDSERTHSNIVEQRADRPRATPVVGTPPLQTDTIPLQRSIPWK